MAIERFSGQDAHYCWHCGRTTTSHDCRVCETRPTAPEPGGAGADRVPGPLQVAQVLLGLSAVGDLLWAAVALGLGWMGLRLAQASSASQGVDGIFLLAAVLGVFLVVVGVVKLRIKRGLGEGKAKARDALRALIVVDTLVAVLAAAVGAASVLAVMAVVVGNGLLAALVWGPASSRRHFGDPPVELATPGALGGHLAPHGGAAMPFPAATHTSTTARQDPMTVPIRIPGR